MFNIKYKYQKILHYVDTPFVLKIIHYKISHFEKNLINKQNVKFVKIYAVIKVLFDLNSYLTSECAIQFNHK